MNKAPHPLLEMDMSACSEKCELTVERSIQRINTVPSPFSDRKAAERLYVEIDVARYQDLIDHPDIPDDAKNEFIKALWLVLTELVDLGFNLHPVQLAQSDRYSK